MCVSVGMDVRLLTPHDLALPARGVAQPLPPVCPLLPCPALPPAAGTLTLPLPSFPSTGPVRQLAEGRPFGAWDWPTEEGGEEAAAGSETPLLPLHPAERLSQACPHPSRAGGICAPAGGGGLASWGGLGEYGLFSLGGGVGWGGWELSVIERGRK